jgi:cytochrome d ubiquinol oxidase subunit I
VNVGDLVAVARWQFGITTVYHFLMVPLTIGLTVLVAAMQTAWVRTGKRHYFAMTKFWGKLMLVNFAMGVVTGIVQEFQFGMNWSEYSRFVGDVFGPPLAMEGLIAFFIESTFLGLWIFGWERLRKGVHLACIWAVAVANVLSAYFILAANSWMQHPVGVKLVNGKPVLTSIWAVLTNNTLLAASSHTLLGCLSVGGTFLVCIAFWHLARRHRKSARDDPDRQVWFTSLRWGAWVGLVAFAGLALTGDSQGKLMFQQQPMKMASAEALCHTQQPASFSVFAIGNVAQPNCESVKSLDVPNLLSFLATGSFTSRVAGVQDLIPQYQAAYGTNYPNDPTLGSLAGTPIDYVPNLVVEYWGFRLMIGFGGLAALAAAVALWFTRGGRFPDNRWTASPWVHRLALLAIATPFLANVAGWIFTEMGRQPFVVVPNPTGVHGVWLFTAQAVSSGVSLGEMVTSLVTFCLLYGGLAVIEFVLIARYVRADADSVLPPDSGPTASTGPGESGAESDALSFAY